MPRKQRSNPKTKHRAVELRKKSTPAERKLWSRIRNDQLGVAFRRQCINRSKPHSTPSEFAFLISAPPEQNSSSNWMAASISNNRNTTKKERNIWNHWATK